ncbi:hypothetical protein KC333_g6992 [Hortaea werneckii]|nr:hypothetical protein KC333_g6992 [Hortaea werneckii]KAI7310988.1 hypothetical protein KC326_g6467 [Hortaea werneckii]
MHTTLLFTIASTLLGLSAAKDVTLLEAKCQQICCDDKISGSEKFCELALGSFCSCSADLKRDGWSWKSPQTVTVTPEWCIAPKLTTSRSTITETFSVTTTKSSMTPPKPTTSCSTTTETFSVSTTPVRSTTKSYMPPPRPSTSCSTTTMTYSVPVTMKTTTSMKPTTSCSTTTKTITPPVPSSRYIKTTSTQPDVPYSTSCSTYTSTVSMTPTVYVVSKGTTISTKQLSPTMSTTVMTMSNGTYSPTKSTSTGEVPATTTESMMEKPSGSGKPSSSVTPPLPPTSGVSGLRLSLTVLAGALLLALI